MVDQAVFESSPASVAQARAFVTESLQGYSPLVLERVTLMVSELATNAVRHAGTPFEVSVHHDEGELRVEVADEGGGQPVQRDPAVTDASGRGLLIVSRLSSAWGVDLRGHTNVVWFSVLWFAMDPVGS